MMRAALFIAFLLIPSLSWARDYSTSFPATENPISQSSNWVNGAATGLDWNNIQTTGGTPGIAFGTQPTGAANYTDSIATLNGTWGAQQECQATVKTSSPPTANFAELECLLNFTISAHSATGYEFNASVQTNDCYNQIVRWNGSLGSFTVLCPGAGCTTSGLGGTATCLHNGDVLTATLVGGVLTEYINGTKMAYVTDTTYTTGSPGIGHYNQGNAGSTDSSYGFSNLFITDAFVNENNCVSQANSGATGPTYTMTFPFAITTGDAVAGGFSWDSSSTTLTSIKVGTTSTTIVNCTGGSPCLDSPNAQSLVGFYLGNISGSPTTVVATASNTTGFNAFTACEVAGVATSSTLDGSAGQFQSAPGTTANAITTGSFTSSAGDAIMAVVIDSSAQVASGDYSAGTGYTINQQGGGTTTIDYASEDQVTTATSTTATFTQATNHNSLSIGMAFKLANPNPSSSTVSCGRFTLMGVGC